ncbi:hypothetical protein HO133_009890 [Letharia lupina]|uniref:Uncharacterized protein n=1 Tax=Letharia lupina TaxID=560253 RepID=A0A8H6FFF5_9LECA|nr:uncharacterized protein HO133_009890 [Letharia lupina]KAF6225888.1 hypothetical protein HO133_009890 [Letharia lupina]
MEIIRMPVELLIEIFMKCDIKKDWKVLRLAPNMLRSLHVCMPNYPYDRVGKEARVAKSKLLWALRSCPGLHSLTTYDPNVYRNNRGLGASEPWHDLKPEFLLPQLAELTIADRTFEVDDLLKWGAKGGWTKLIKITLWDDRLLYGFQGCEQSLRSISLLHTKAGNENALVSICSRTIRLTELKIKTEESRLPFSALMICGPSLETLAIHPHRDALDNWINMQDDHLSALSQIPQLAEITLHTQKPQGYEKHKSSLAAVEHAFRHVIEHGGNEQNLRSLILYDGPQTSDWDNPWGLVERSSRAFKATRGTHGGNMDQNICAKHIQGPSETDHERYHRQQERVEAEKKTRDYLDAMPPAVLSQMIDNNRRQIRGTTSDIQEQMYEIQTGGWNPELAEYEERWKNSSGILPMLEWQLQTRKKQGWKLWDMPLMRSDAGSEGFLYDRMMEASAES